MITFYYLNRQEIERQYAQIVPYIVESIEESTNRSGRAEGRINFGGWLKSLGLPLGEVELGGGLEERSNQTILRKLSEEHKLLLVWKDLQEKGRLRIVKDAASEALRAGETLLFEGHFTVADQQEEGVSRVEGNIGDKRLILLFSEKYVPESVLASLRIIPEEIPLSGYGTVIQGGESVTVVRPIAFGQGFVDSLDTVR